MMQTRLKVVLMGGLLLLADGAANAQKPSACPPAEKAVHVSQVSSVTGCPFSAVIENETTRTLADGTHIQNTVKELVYRDSLGRIRYESYGPTPAGKNAPESPNFIQILDPVAGFLYFLTPQYGTATRMRLNDPTTNPKANVQPRQSSPQDSTSKQTEQQSKPDRVVETLGAQIMEGVLVTGRRDTVTIPVGERGNDRPIQVVSEVWDSRELGIRLLVKTSDPRTGDVERRMTNLNRTEPDPSLFQVLADYRIKDE
jgi:hypothetical protein